MSHDRKKALKGLPAAAQYEVGYKKPPVTTRFKPGQSGNPKGRPRGSKNRPLPPAVFGERLKGVILEEAYRTISINNANGTTTMPMAKAIVRALTVNAAKGQHRAQQLFTDLLAATEREKRREHFEILEAAVTYKIEWGQELEWRAQLGILGPEPLPHPDHVLIDARSGTVRIVGPVTKEEKAEWTKRKAEFEEEVRWLQRELAKSKGAPSSSRRSTSKGARNASASISNYSGGGSNRRRVSATRCCCPRFLA